MHSQFDRKAKAGKNGNEPFDDSKLTQEERREHTWQELGFDGPPEFAPESEAPPINAEGRELIRRVVERKGSDEDHKKLANLQRHKIWYDAVRTAVYEYFERFRRENPAEVEAQLGEDHQPRRSNLPLSP
jgi:hypothetical protein